MITGPHSHTSHSVLYSVYFTEDLCPWFPLALMGASLTNWPHTEKGQKSPQYKLADGDNAIFFLTKAHLSKSSSTAAATTQRGFFAIV